MKKFADDDCQPRCGKKFKKKCFKHAKNIPGKGMKAVNKIDDEDEEELMQVYYNIK